MNTLRLVLRSGMLLFMTVILLCTGSLAVGAAYPLWDLLVFSQLIGGQNDLFLADSTGRVVNLTRTPRASEVHPAWSPDGNSIAYISNATFNEELYIMQLADGTAEQITRTNRSHALPSWAPDGSAIAVAFLTSYAMNQSDVFTLDLTTGERRNLTEVGVSNVIAGTLPKWSPNGEYVAFINEGQQSVHVAQLPYGEIVAQSTSDTFAPAWAPDGTRLVYVGPRTRFTASTPDTLYVRDVTIPDEIPLGFSQDMQRILSPVWSPDGTQIAFIGEPFDRFTGVRSPAQRHMDIYVLDVTTGAVRRITDVGATITNRTLDWSPDGRMVAFSINGWTQGQQLCIQWVNSARHHCLAGVAAKSITWQPRATAQNQAFGAVNSS